MSPDDIETAFEVNTDEATILIERTEQALTTLKGDGLIGIDDTQKIIDRLVDKIRGMIKVVQKQY